MKNFILGLFVGAVACVVVLRFQCNQSLNLLNQLYFTQPRDGCLEEWIYSVDKLLPAERNLVCENLGKCTETFLLAYLGVNITNHTEFVRLVDRYSPIKKVLE